MLIKSQSIVIHTIKYSDSSVILHLFGEKIGRKALLLRGVGSKKNSKSALIQPLTLVEIIADIKDGQKLSTIRQIERSAPLNNIPFDVYKSSMALFAAEFLHRSIPEHYSNENLFQFLHHSIQWLDQTDEPLNFHLYFLLKMALHLGYYPDSESKPHDKHFDLREGIFTPIAPDHPDYISGENYTLLKHLLGMKFDVLLHYRFKNRERRTLLHLLIDYHKLQTTGLNKLQSHEVLQTIFE